MKRVELEPAHSWHCDECSELNFCLPTRPEFTDEDREELFRKLNHMDDFEELPSDWNQFDVLSIPDTVTCSQCKTTFEAYDIEQFDMRDIFDDEDSE